MNWIAKILKLLSRTRTKNTSTWVWIRSYQFFNGTEKNVYEYLCFTDSFHLMQSSLEALVHNLSKFKLSILNKVFPNYTVNQISLLQQKAYYPYGFMISFEKFEAKKLPNLSQRLNSVQTYEAVITKSHYQHAIKIFEELNCQFMGEYHEMYLKVDVAILGLVLREFRLVCFETTSVLQTYLITRF